MLVLFAIPKPFRQHNAIIQRNAITSWTLLRPRPQVILFGGDEGTAEAARDLGVSHTLQITRSEYGTPLVNDLFTEAQRLGDHPILCYVNADIVLTSDFMRAVERVVRRKLRFLMVGQRWDIDIQGSLDFRPGWEETLRAYVGQHGKLHPHTGIDYFVFSRGILWEIPPFAVGRPAWDNWLIYRARSQGVAVIDATRVVTAVHQNHDYSHVAGGEHEAWEGPEAKRNRALAGTQALFTLHDANWLLTPRLLVPALTSDHLRRRWAVLPILHPRLRVTHKVIHLLVFALIVPCRVLSAVIRHISGQRKE